LQDRAESEEGRNILPAQTKGKIGAAVGKAIFLAVICRSSIYHLFRFVISATEYIDFTIQLQYL
jgi:hypothetical protein